MPPVSYPEFIERLKREQGHDRAMEAAIGRQFDRVGEIPRAFPIQSGFLPQHYLVDYARRIAARPGGESVCILRKR